MKAKKDQEQSPTKSFMDLIDDELDDESDSYSDSDERINDGDQDDTDEDAPRSELMDDGIKREGNRAAAHARGKSFMQIMEGKKKAFPPEENTLESRIRSIENQIHVLQNMQVGDPGHRQHIIMGLQHNLQVLRGLKDLDDQGLDEQMILMLNNIIHEFDRVNQIGQRINDQDARMMHRQRMQGIRVVPSIAPFVKSLLISVMARQQERRRQEREGN